MSYWVSSSSLEEVLELRLISSLDFSTASSCRLALFDIVLITYRSFVLAELITTGGSLSLIDSLKFMLSLKLWLILYDLICSPFSLQERGSVVLDLSLTEINAYFKLFVSKLLSVVFFSSINCVEVFCFFFNFLKVLKMAVEQLTIIRRLVMPKTTIISRMQTRLKLSMQQSSQLPSPCSTSIKSY